MGMPVGMWMLMVVRMLMIVRMFVVVRMLVVVQMLVVVRMLVSMQICHIMIMVFMRRIQENPEIAGVQSRFFHPTDLNFKSCLLYTSRCV